MPPRTTSQRRMGNRRDLDSHWGEISIDFAIGPDVSPLEAMEWVGAVVALPPLRFLEGVPGALARGFPCRPRPPARLAP